MNRVATVAVLLTLMFAALVSVDGSHASAQSVRPASLATPLTAMFVDGEDGATVTGGHSYSFAAVTASHSGAALTFAVNQSGHSFTITFAPVDGQALMVADYTYTQRVADGSHIGLDLSGDGVACTTASGAFSVDQISLDGSGNPVTFSSRFEFHCNAEDPAVIGAVSYNATADYRTTTMPTAVADFGSVAAGGVPTPWKEVTVTNNGPSDLTLSSQGPDSLNFGVYLATCGQFTVLHVGESCVYQVRFQPLVGAAGPQSAWLRINENLAPSGGSAVRRIRLTGFVSSNPTPSWISFGGAVTADPSAVADPQDPSGVYAFVRGGDGALYWQHATGSTWSGYHAAGGVLTSLPFAVADPAGVSGTVGSYVFVRGGDGALYVGRIVGGVWQGWQPLGGNLTSFPATVVDSSGLWVAVRGGDGALYARHLTSTGWSGWQNFGGYLDSPPSLAADASGAYAFVAGGDGALYARNIRGVASWQSLGGYVTAAPVGVGDAAGISVFVRGGDGATYWRHESGGAWTPLQYLGWYSTSAPLGVADTIGVSVYVRGSDGALYRRHFDGASWTGWSRLGGYLASDPIPVSDGLGFERVFVVGGDSQLYTISVLGTASLAPFASASAEAPSENNTAPALDQDPLLGLNVTDARSSRR